MSKKSNKGIIALLIVILLAVLFVGGYYVYGKINADIKGNPDDKTEYTLIIEESDFQYDVSQKLYNNGIVINDSVWSSWMDKHYPDFKMRYEVDPVRQAIADSWPDKMDDSCARAEWDWAPSYDLETMTVDMIKSLKKKFSL